MKPSDCLLGTITYEFQHKSLGEIGPMSKNTNRGRTQMPMVMHCLRLDVGVPHDFVLYCVKSAFLESMPARGHCGESQTFL